MAQIKRYFTNGSFDDEKFVGLTLAEFTYDDVAEEYVGVQMTAGTPFLGYMAKEITAEEHATYRSWLANPADSKYELGVFGNGLLSPKTKKKYLELKEAAVAAAETEEAKKLLPAYARAERMAVSSGGTALDVLRDFRPDIPEKLLVRLAALSKEA